MPYLLVKSLRSGCVVQLFGKISDHSVYYRDLVSVSVGPSSSNLSSSTSPYTGAEGVNASTVPGVAVLYNLNAFLQIQMLPHQ